jgi:hypothetical protein
VNKNEEESFSGTVGRTHSCVKRDTVDEDWIFSVTQKKTPDSPKEKSGVSKTKKNPNIMRGENRADLFLHIK